MKALKSRAAVIAGALLASTAMLVPLAAPAGAATLVDGCSFITNPASGGAQSALRVACNFPTASAVPAQNNISDFSNAVWHNGAAKAVNGIAFEGAYGLTAVYSPNAHFTAADTNRIIYGTIGGTAIGAYTNIKVYVDAQTVLLNMPATTTGVSGKTAGDAIAIVAKVENSSVRAGVGAITTPSATSSVTGVALTAGAAGVATAKKTGWTAANVGKQIVSTRITGGSAIITGVNNSTGTATLSAAVPASRPNETVALNTFGMVISPTLGFAASDVGRSIDGTPLSTTAKIVNTGTVSSDMSTAIAGSGALTGFTYAQVTGAVAFSQADLTTTPANPNQISVGSDEIYSTTRLLSIDGEDYTIDAENGKITGPAGTFRGSDKGLPVAGCGIFTGANGSNTPGATGQNYITDVALNGSWASLAGGAYGTSPACNAVAAYGINVSIGLTTQTAAADGDVMSIISSTLNLSPALVPGSDACATNTYEGTTITGQWYNPGVIGASLGGQQSVSLNSSFVPSAVKAPSNTIGGIKYPTAVVSFWAFVTQRTAEETVGTGLGAKTFAKDTAKIVLPWVPTLLALCDGTGISSEYLFSGTSIGTQTVSTGTGRPSTALRGLKKGALAGSVAYQPVTAAGASSTWTGAGKFAAAGALGQGVTAKLTLN